MRSTASAASETDRSGISSIFAPMSSSSGPMCSVRMWMRRFTLGSTSMAATIFCWSAVEAASPMSRPFISIARITAMTMSRTPMASVPTPSHTGSSVTWAMLTAARARTRPTRAPKSSSRTTGSSGSWTGG